MRHPLEKRKSTWLVWGVALGAAFAASILCAILTQGSILVAWYQDQAVPVGLLSLLVYLAIYTIKISYPVPFSLGHPGEFFSAVSTTVGDHLDKVDLLDRLHHELALCGLTALCAGAVAFRVTWAFAPMQDRVKHLEGRELVEGGRAWRIFKRAERSALKATGRGLELAPGFTMSRQRETRHILCVGSTGSGKTLYIRNELRQILARNDRAIIHDSKGDMTSGFPSDHFLLLAPQDARSAIWDIGADIRMEQDAREFAAAMIPESHDPIWSRGAREIFLGVIIALRTQHGHDWGWSELKQQTMVDARKLRHLMQKYYPVAADYLVLDAAGVPTKTALSYWVTLCAHLAGTLSPLARAWPDDSEAQRFSIRKWLQNEASPDRHIILQRAPHWPELSAAWTSAFIQNFANASVGPLLPDNHKRRIWMVLDEFAQLGKIKGFQQILEAGRSKGICTIVGLQDPHQLAEHYGADAAKTWMSSFGTKLIFQMTASASATMICSEVIGKRRVSWTNKGKSVAPMRLDGQGQGTTRSRQEEEREVDVVTPAYLESALGWFGTWSSAEIRILLVGVGTDDRGYVIKLDLPIEPWPALRPAMQPAGWTRL